MAPDVEESSTPSPTPQLQLLDPRRTARLKPDPGLSWVLDQYDGPVGRISPATYGWSLDLAAEQWCAAVRRRRRRLGWHLEFWRQREQQPALSYQPRTLLSGGRLSLVGGGSYKLSMVRSQWTLVDESGGEILRIALHHRHSGTKDLGGRFTFGERAVHEPQLPMIVLAASLASLIHDVQTAAG